VKVTDEVWRDFRLAAGGRSVAAVLGELVTDEVERYRVRRLRAGQVDDRELLEALYRARELHDAVSVIVRRLERRLDQRGGPAG
jgi:hypothetical protein